MPVTRSQLLVLRFLRSAVIAGMVVAFATGCPRRGPGPGAAMPIASRPAAAPAVPVVEKRPARIVVVNPRYGFVVLDFLGRPLPPTGARLEIYRDGKRVGAVRTTEPMRARFVSADVLEGELRSGDEAR